jgi:Ca2+-binding RTX toxin-like protein
MATGQLITGSDNVNDSLTGTTGDDTLRGLSGNDTLNGGAGADSLEGGLGDDVYIVDQTGDKVVEAAGGGLDRVESAVTWTLAGTEVENLSLTGTAAINGTGNGAANSLLGNAANNRLEGGGGDDYLDGRGGVDTLVGGTGGDWYVLDSSTDSITENLGEGDDTVEVTFDNYTLGANLEYLYLIQGSAAVTASGNGLDNELVGNEKNNILLAGGGNDFLDGGSGEDIMNGGTGDDNYVVNSAGDLAQENANEGLDTVTLIGSLANYTLAANVENLTTIGANGFRLAGNALDNKITSGSGADTLAGLAGNDALAGAGGNDLLIGDDVVTVRARADLMAGIGAIMEVRVEGVLIGTVQVNSTTFADYSFAAVLPAGTATKVTVTFTNDAGDGNGGDRNLIVDSVSVNGVTKASSTAVYDRYAYDGLDTLPGATGTMAWNGTLVFGFATQATVGGMDTLSGGSGADTLAGGLGDDLYAVDNLGDLVVEGLDGGWDTVEATVDNYALTDNVETLILGGSTVVTGSGNGLDNELIGNAAANVLKGLAGDDYFDGGAGNDTLFGGTGDDRYFVIDAGDDIRELANEGTDTATVYNVAGFKLAANVENLNTIGTGLGGAGFQLTGNELANRITGSSIADTLVGYAGADTLVGGAGNDRLFGDDVLVVRARSDLFQGLGALMEVKVDGVVVGQVYVNNSTGFADFYFPVSLPVGTAGKITVGFLNDAAGGGADRNLFVESITLNGTVKLPSTAVYDRYELDGVDTLPGGTGAMPWGGALIFDYAAQTMAGGDDYLSGGTGADTASGGRGNDTYVVDNTGDVIIELANDGTEQVNASASYTLSDNLENLTLTGTAAINGTGNDLVNDIRGNSGNNRLDGGTGADILTGGLGDDTYVIDTLADTINEVLGEGNDTVETSVTYTLGATLENLRLVGYGWIDGTGNGGNNVIEGNAGNNVLDGGSGADILRGGEGDDTYIVDSEYDVVQEVADLDDQGNVRFGGTDTVKSGIDYVLDKLVENLTLTGSAVYGTGNAADNTLVGNAADNTLIGLGGADYIDGGAGADVMVGGLDGDTYVVDNTGDSIVESTNGGIDTVVSSLSWTLATTLENLQLTGSAATGTGNGSANLLSGSDVANTLDGQGGDDTLQGGKGADTLIGGTGNDLFIVENGAQVVRENAGEGTDTVRVQGLQAYTLTANVENGWISSAGFSATTVLSLSGNLGANTLNGSFGNDQLYGDTGNDTLLGGYGRDTLNGGLGADSLVGGQGDDYYIVDEAGDRIVEKDREGNDTVASDITISLAGTFLENLQLTGLAATNGTGSDGNNQLTGNSAANTLTGGGGNDTLNGGAGNDILAGGTGNDSYIVEGSNDTINELAGEGTDLVTTGVSYTLGANLEQLTLSGTAAVNGTGNALANLITGNAAGNVLDGSTGIDTLVGGDGSDTYYLDNASDVIVEKAGGTGSDAAYLNFSGTYVFDADNGWIETIHATAAGAVNVTGNGANNVFFGNAGADVFSGGAGNDIALAGAGNDTLVAGAGYDYLSGSTGADTYIVDLALGGVADLAIGDTNQDVLDIRGVTDKSQLTFRRVVAEYATEESEWPDWVNGAGTTVEIGRVGGGGTVVVDLFKADGTNATRLQTIKVGTQTLSYDEIRAAVTYVATGGNDRLYGFSGADTLSGGEGNDSLEGAGGNDVLSGGNGADSLFGGLGSDNLDGGAGNDTLYGTAGADVLNGGSGNDSYVLTDYAGGAVSSATIVDNDATVGNSDSLSLDFNPYRTLFQQSGNDLRISAVGASNAIVVKDWFVGGTTNHIETLNASGLDTANTALLRSGTLTDAKVQSLVSAMSGFAPVAGQTQFTDAATLAAINSAWTITTQAA